MSGKGKKYEDFARSQTCPACGANARHKAKFCDVCGRALQETAYLPLDHLKSSYNLQNQKNAADNLPTPKELFETNKNSLAETALACVVYSLVPYLGILFCPGALVLGGFGLYAARQQPSLGGGQIAIKSIFYGLLTFAAQLFLWWLLFIVPKLGRGL